MNLGTKIYTGFQIGIGSVFLGSILYTKYNPQYVHQINKFLISVGLINQIEREKYEKYLNGNLGEIYLPNIIGLAAGYETHGNNVSNLFDLGFGFQEVGSLNPQASIEEDFKNKNQIYPKEKYVSYENDEENLSVLKAKAYIGTFKKKLNDYYKYPIGTNITANKETKLFTPYLSDSDLIQGAQEVMSVSDYIVLNFQGPESKGLQHLLEDDKLKDLVQEIRQQRSKSIGIDAIMELEDNQIQKETNGKQLYNKIYTQEIFGKNPCLDKVTVPKIYIKLSDVIQNKEIQDIAKNYKEIGIEGLVIVNDNKNNPNKILRQVYSLSEGRLPVVSVGGIDQPEKIIDRIKNGASAVQICSSLYLQGPKYVDNLLSGLVEKLKEQNIDNIRQIRNIDIQ